MEDKKITRREFLKKGAVIGGTAVVGSTFSFGILSAKSPKITLTFSTMFPTSYFWTPVAQKWTKYVEEKSNGEVKFNFFHSGQLFKAKAELPALQRGEIDVSIPNANYQSGTIPGSDVGALPFLLRDEDDAWHVIQEGLWDIGLKQKWLEKGIRVLAETPGGMYQFGNLRHEIKGPDDVKGLIWAVSSKAHAKAIEVLGGSPTFMSSGRLYTAFQRKTIDGCLRPYLTYTGRKLYEVMKYLTVANVGNYTILLAFNNKKFKSLPKDIQNLLQSSAHKWAEWSFAGVKDTKAKALKIFKEHGMKVHILDDAAFNEFKSRLTSVYDWWIKQVPDGKKYIDFIETHHLKR